MGYRKAKGNTDHLTPNEFRQRIRFRLKKPTDNFGKGKIFDCFGGIVYGAVLKVNGIEKKYDFKNKDYFEGVINFSKEELKLIN